jgi:hypothetical protein
MDGGDMVRVSEGYLRFVYRVARFHRLSHEPGRYDLYIVVRPALTAPISA